MIISKKTRLKAIEHLEAGAINKTDEDQERRLQTKSFKRQAQKSRKPIVTGEATIDYAQTYTKKKARNTMRENKGNIK